MDIKTIILSISTTNFIGFLAILILHLSRFPVNGTLFWVIGRFITTLGLFLLFLRDLIPGFASIVLGNGMVIGGHLIVWLGMQRFVDYQIKNRPLNILAGIILSLVLAGICWYYLVNPTLWARAALIASSLCLISVLAARDLLTSASQTMAIKITGICYAINAAMMAISAIMIVKDTPSGPLMSSGPLVAVSYMYAHVFGFLMTFGMILMITQKLQLKLERQATEDPLTGVYNRRALHMMAEHEFTAMLRNKTCLSVLMIDLDFFKKINDRHGHKVGDRMLIHFTQIVRDTIRAEDLLFRYGGEEFVVLIRNADINGTSQLAERIRAACSVTPLPAGDKLVGFTVSIGQASAKLDDDDFYQVIERADKALYHAKEQGRDRVVIFDSMESTC